MNNNNNNAVLNCSNMIGSLNILAIPLRKIYNIQYDTNETEKVSKVSNRTEKMVFLY